MHLDVLKSQGYTVSNGCIYIYFYVWMNATNISTLENTNSENTKIPNKFILPKKTLNKKKCQPQSWQLVSVTTMDQSSEQIIYHNFLNLNLLGMFSWAWSNSLTSTSHLGWTTIRGNWSLEFAFRILPCFFWNVPKNTHLKHPHKLKHVNLQQLKGFCHNQVNFPYFFGGKTQRPQVTHPTPSFLPHLTQ